MLALVTGSTDGIGFETSRQLVKLGFSVIVHGRNRERCSAKVNELKAEFPSSEIYFICSDFSSLSEVKKMADEIISRFEKLDVLINNAGLFMPKKIITTDRYETTFQVNYLAPFLLTKLLLPLLQKSVKGRIVNVSSMVHSWVNIDFENLNGEKYYNGEEAYALSKLCNILFTYKLNRLLKDKNITVNALHPGVIGTKLLQAGWGIGGAPVEKGAETSVYLASSDEVENVSGKYFADKGVQKSSDISYDENLQNKIWKISEEMVERNNF